MKQLRMFVLALLCACCLSTTYSCKEKKAVAAPAETASQVGEESTAKADNHNADALKARVEAIYKDVANVYNKCNEGEGMDLTPIQEAKFDEKYCSANWNKLLDEVATIDKALPDGEMGFFDADYWIMGQDFSDVSATDVKVEKIDGDQAVVVFNLHNSGNVSRVKLDMVYERGDWFIDDFTGNYSEDAEDQFGWKGGMIDYIKEHNQ